MEKKRRGGHRLPIPPPEKTPSIHDLITRDKSISYLTDKVTRYRSYGWSRARDNVSEQVQTAVDKSELKFENGNTIFGELIYWAKKKPTWKGKLIGVGSLVPCDITERIGVGDSSSITG